MTARRSSDRRSVRLDLTVLLGPDRPDELWKAEKSGWRCFVMGNHHAASYRRGSRLRAAWQRGFDAAARSADPERLML